MYESFFGFKRRPFSPLPDPALFYPSPGHRQAMRLVASPLHTPGGWLLLTGEAGIGKTALARHLLQQRQAEMIGLISAHPRAGPLWQAIGAAYGIALRTADPASQRQALCAALATPAAHGSPAILIIDDAQDLDRNDLEALLTLDPENNLRLLLLARPELGERLRQPGYAGARARIVLFYQINRLDLDESIRYVRYRLEHAGGPTDLFTQAAYLSLFEYSRGLPRLINLVCERALIIAQGLGAWSIDERIIDQAMRDPASLPSTQDTLAEGQVRLANTNHAGLRPAQHPHRVRPILPDHADRSAESLLDSDHLPDQASSKPSHPKAASTVWLKPADDPRPSTAAGDRDRRRRPAPRQARRSLPALVFIAAGFAVSGIIGWYLHATWTREGVSQQDAPSLTVPSAATSAGESVADAPANGEASVSPSAQMAASEASAEQPGFDDLIRLAQEPSGPTHTPAIPSPETTTADIEPAPALARLAARLNELGIGYEWRAPDHLRADLSPKIQFREGSVALDGPARAFLAQFAAAVKEEGDIRLHVRAHTDSRGAKANNQTLSQRRAADVALILRLNGIPGARVTHEGKGSAEPRFSPEEERRLGPSINRRLEIDLIAGTANP